MKRVGKCLRCSACCTTRKLWKSLNPYEKFATVVLSRGRIFAALVRNTKCRHLYRNGMDTYGCRIYESRPDFCRAHPDRPEDILPGCGFRFIEETEIT